MTNDELLKLINDKPDSFVQIIKAKNRGFYDEIDKKYSIDGKFSEKIYKHLYPQETGICKQCDVNKTKFMSFFVGYAQYCGKKCANTASSSVRAEIMIENNKKTRHEYYEKINCIVCNVEFEALKYRNQKCCSNACSAKNTATDPNRLRKIKKAKLERYGSENYVNTDKYKATCLEKYGVDNVFKAETIKSDIKGNNLEKYGVEHNAQRDDVKIKIKTTILQRYGVDNIAKSDAIKKRVRDAFNRKYGVNNVFQHVGIRNKIYEGNIKKYGTKFTRNFPHIRLILYKSVISTILRKNDITALFTFDEYTTTKNSREYKFKCNKCNIEFFDHIDRNHPRCMTCNPYIKGFSLDEKEILEYIKSIYTGSIIENDRKILDGLELDIYIPDKKVAIEFNGLYWHSEFTGRKDKSYHLHKTESCLSKNIQLIQIFEDEWRNKRDVLKRKIKHILNQDYDNIIYAKKCNVTAIDNCSTFLDNTHIQGACASQIKLGAYHNNELVAVMTFGKPRVALGTKTSVDGEYELLRFSTNSHVVGIGGKLLSFFIKTYSPSKIITFADRRYSIGNLYDKLGFKKIGETPPNYWYFKQGHIERHHRFAFRKDQLSKKLKTFDVNLSEWQNMKNNGYDRIWDCGSIKYELIIPNKIS